MTAQCDRPETEYLRVQIMRLSSLPGWPREPEGVAELIAIAEDSGVAEQALRAVVDDLARYAERCPSSSELWTALWRLSHEPGERPLGQPGCKDCNGSGFRIREIGGREGAERCGCRRPKF